MKIYLPLNNGILSAQCFTSLKGACKVLDVDYDQAVRGKREWGDKVIKEIEVIKQVRNHG